MSNETFGITFQYAICKIYNLKNGISKKRIDRDLFRVFTGSKIIPEIFSDCKPIRYLSDSEEYTSEFIKKCPHSFLLENNETFSVRTFQGKGKMFAPKVVGQAGDETFNHFFGHLFDEEISRLNFKEFCLKHIDEILPIVIDYALVSDFNCWLYNDDGRFRFDVIKRQDLPELTFNRGDFTFTKPSVKAWVESNTVKYKGDTILELQLHSNRTGYKIRLHRDNFPMLLKVEKKSNNSVLGDTAELAICNVFGLDASVNNVRLLKNSDATTLKMFEKHYVEEKENLFPLKPIRYNGTDGRDRGGRSKSGVDFLLENNATLSVKTNKSKSFKVCPPEIGQPSPKTFDLHFGKMGLYDGDINEEKFRALVNDKEKVVVLLSKYVKFLNECDYILWSKLCGDDGITSNLLKKCDLEGITFDPDLIGYSNDFVSKNSVTIKYGVDDLSLGEFQVHSARNSLKFRFNIASLLSLYSLKSSR